MEDSNVVEYVKETLKYSLQELNGEQINRESTQKSTFGQNEDQLSE